MHKNIFKIAAASLLVAIIAAAPSISRAEDSAQAPADQTTPAKAKKKGISFTGNLEAVDTNAMTLTVSNLVLHVSSDTIIKKGSQPATLSDAVVGQPTRGTYQKGDGDKLTALTVHLNSKAGGKGKKKKPAADANQ